MSFSEWKTKTMVRLINLTKQYSSNAKAVNDLNTIIVKLKYVKVRDLSTILMYFHLASANVPELLELIPTTEEVEEWFKSEKSEF